MATGAIVEDAPRLPPQVEAARKARQVEESAPGYMRGLPMLLFGDFLKVRNDDNARQFQYYDAQDKVARVREVTGTWVFQWNRKHYAIPPRETVFVPFEALVDALGDPRSMEEPVRYNDGNNDRGVILRRHEEISRLFARYAIRGESLEALIEMSPKLTVTTLSEQPVIFPAFRPDMLAYPAPRVDEHVVDSSAKQITDRLASENADLRDRMARYEQLLERFMVQREGFDPPPPPADPLIQG